MILSLKTETFYPEWRESLLLVAIRVIDSQGHFYLESKLTLNQRCGDLAWLVIRIEAFEILEGILDMIEERILITTT